MICKCTYSLQRTVYQKNGLLHMDFNKTHDFRNTNSRLHHHQSTNMKLFFLLFGVLSGFCSSQDLENCSTVTNTIAVGMCDFADDELEDLHNYICNPIERDDILTTLHDVHTDVSSQMDPYIKKVEENFIMIESDIITALSTKASCIEEVKQEYSDLKYLCDLEPEQRRKLWGSLKNGSLMLNRSSLLESGGFTIN